MIPYKASGSENEPEAEAGAFTAVPIFQRQQYKHVFATCPPAMLQQPGDVLRTPRRQFNAIRPDQTQHPERFRMQGMAPTMMHQPFGALRQRIPEGFAANPALMPRTDSASTATSHYNDGWNRRPSSGQRANADGHVSIGLSSPVSCGPEADALSRSVCSVAPDGDDIDRNRHNAAYFKAERLKLAHKAGPLRQKYEERKREAAQENFSSKKAALEADQELIRERIDALKREKDKVIEGRDTSYALTRATSNNKQQSQDLEELEKEYARVSATWKEKVKEKKIELESITKEIQEIESQDGAGAYEQQLEGLKTAVDEKMAEELSLSLLKAKVQPKYEKAAEELERVKEALAALERKLASAHKFGGGQLAGTELMAKCEKVLRLIEKEEAGLRFDEDLNEDIRRQIEAQETTTEEISEKIRKLKVAEQNKVKSDDQPSATNLSQKIREAKSELNKLERNLDGAIRARPISPSTRRAQIERSETAQECTRNFRLQIELMLLRQVGTEVVRDMEIEG